MADTKPMKIRFLSLHQIEYPGKLYSTDDPRVFRTQPIYQQGVNGRIYHLIAGVELPERGIAPYFQTTVTEEMDLDSGKILKSNADIGLEVMTEACNKMADSGNWPNTEAR